MTTIDSILSTALAHPRRIVLPEGEDPRILDACSQAASKQLVNPIVVGNQDTIRSLATDHNIDLAGVTIVDPADASYRSRYINVLVEARRHKGMTPEQANEQLDSSLVFAGCMVRAGDADGCVAGAMTATASPLSG